MSIGIANTRRMMTIFWVCLKPTWGRSSWDCDGGQFSKHFLQLGHHENRNNEIRLQTICIHNKSGQVTHFCLLPLTTKRISKRLQLLCFATTITHREKKTALHNLGKKWLANFLTGLSNPNTTFFFFPPRPPAKVIKRKRGRNSSFYETRKGSCWSQRGLSSCRTVLAWGGMGSY